MLVTITYTISAYHH